MVKGKEDQQPVQWTPYHHELLATEISKFIIDTETEPPFETIRTNLIASHPEQFNESITEEELKKNKVLLMTCYKQLKEVILPLYPNAVDGELRVNLTPAQWMALREKNQKTANIILFLKAGGINSALSIISNALKQIKYDETIEINPELALVREEGKENSEQQVDIGSDLDDEIAGFIIAENEQSAPNTGDKVTIDKEDAVEENVHKKVEENQKAGEEEDEEAQVLETESNVGNLKAEEDNLERELVKSKEQNASQVEALDPETKQEVSKNTTTGETVFQAIETDSSDDSEIEQLNTKESFIKELSTYTSRKRIASVSVKRKRKSRKALWTKTKKQTKRKPRRPLRMNEDGVIEVSSDDDDSEIEQLADFEFYR